MTLQHVVLFSFADDLAPADAAEMRRQVAAWPEAIGGMRRLRLGTDLTGARTNGYSHLLYMEFDGRDQLVAYQQHPVHQAFHQWVVAHRGTPLAFDYFLDGNTVLMPEDSNHEEEKRP